MIPGGFSYWYNYWISLSGKDRIRSFVNNGGGYFGICADSVFASDKVVWQGITYDNEAFYNAYGELTGYDLDLFPGTGLISGIAPWRAYEMTTVNFQNETAILADYKPVPFTESIFYYGGLYFTIDQWADVATLGHYEYNDEPALVAFTHGSGRVVLTGPHREMRFWSNTNCRSQVRLVSNFSLLPAGIPCGVMKHGVRCWRSEGNCMLRPEIPSP